MDAKGSLNLDQEMGDMKPNFDGGPNELSDLKEKEFTSTHKSPSTANFNSRIDFNRAESAIDKKIDRDSKNMSKLSAGLVATNNGNL